MSKGKDRKMKSLILFEFQKIYKKRMNKIVFFGTFLLMALSMVLNIDQVWTYNEKKETMKGRDYVEYTKSVCKKLEGPITEEKAKEYLEEYQKMLENPEYFVTDETGEHFTDDVYCSYYIPHRWLVTELGHVYDEPGIQSWGENIKKLNLNEIEPLYEARTNRLRDTLIQGSSDWQYTDAEQKYWISEASEIRTPISYGYVEGFNQWFDMASFYCIPLIALFIIMATVYAGEYEQNTDNIILTTKYGKSKIITAKNIAAILYGLLFCTVNVVIGFVMMFGWYGISGWDMPIQSIYFQCPYAVTNLQAAMLFVAAFYAVAMGIISITLWISARSKNGLTVLAIMLVFFFIPIFLKESMTNGVYNHILQLLPYSSLSSFGLQSMVSYPFGKVVIPYGTMRWLTYLCLTVGVLPFAGRAFKHHEVR